MASLNAFVPQGPTILVLASSSTASTATQLTTNGSQGAFVNNPTTVPIYVAFGNSSSVQAAVPTTGTPASGVCITNYIPKCWTVPPNCWVSAATSLGSANLFVTPGFGD